MDSERGDLRDDGCQHQDKNADTKYESPAPVRRTLARLASPRLTFREEALSSLPLVHDESPHEEDSGKADSSPLLKKQPEQDMRHIGCLQKFSRGSDLQSIEARRSWRVAMLLFVSLAVHNFPEVRDG